MNDERRQVRRTNRDRQGQFIRNVAYSPLPNHIKSILTTLAVNLDDKLDWEIAWPSMAHMAKKANCTTRTVERLIKKMMGLSLFYIVKLTGEQLGRSFKRYGLKDQDHTFRVRHLLNTYRPTRHWMWHLQQPTQEDYTSLLEAYANVQLSTDTDDGFKPDTDVGQLLRGTPLVKKPEFSTLEEFYSMSGPPAQVIRVESSRRSEEMSKHVSSAP